MSFNSHRSATANADGSFTVQGATVSMPVVVGRAASLAATWLVKASLAKDLLPDDELVPVQLLPGKTLLSIAAIDYRENDLGSYNEVSIALFVRPRNAPRRVPYLGTMLDLVRSRVGTYISWLPVNESFTRDAGDGIWGFPKTLETIDISYGGDRVSATLTAQGKKVLEISGSTLTNTKIANAEMTTYTHIDGRVHATAFTSGSVRAAVHFRAGAELELGDHPFADRLRGLGLPKRPLMSVWMADMAAKFERPIPL